MTSVVIAPRLEDPTSDTEAVVSGWWFHIRPSKAYVSGGQWVLAEWPPALTPIIGSAVTVLLDALAAVPYELELYKPGDLKHPVVHEYRIVPSSGSPVNWQDLTLVTGPGGDTAPTDTVEARLAALEAALGSVSGGASNLASITDMSAFMRTVNDDTSASAARTTLDAAATSHAHNVSDLNATGGTSSSFLRKDGVWASPPAAGSPDWADITGKPSTFPPDAHTHAVASTDLTDGTAVGVSLMTAADAAAARAAIDALGTDDVLTDANMAVAAVMFADGAGTPRPTLRTDIRVLWTASSAPTNAIAGDVWLNGPD